MPPTTTGAVAQERGPKVSVVLGKGRTESIREAVACLQSGLPNAVDRAFKILHTVSYAGINVDQVGHVVDLLLAQVEFFTTSDEVARLLEAGTDDETAEDLCNPGKDHPNLRFFNPYATADATTARVDDLELKALRLVQVLNILRNVALTRASEVLATHPAVITLIARCVVAGRAAKFITPVRLTLLHMVWKHRIFLQECALDVLAALAAQIELSNKSVEHKCLWDVLLKLVRSSDRNLLVSAITTLSKFNSARENLPWIRTIDMEVMAVAQQYLLLHDAQVLLVVLEFFYQMTLHSEMVERIVKLPGFVPSIVPLVSFAPDRWMDREAAPLLNDDGVDTGARPVSFFDIWPGLNELLCCDSDVEALELPLAVMEPLTCQWLSKCFKFTNDHSSAIKRSDMYTRYMAHCQEYGLIPLSQRVFGCLVRKTFPKCGCITTASLGLSTIYTAIAQRTRIPPPPRNMLKLSVPLPVIAEDRLRNPPPPPTAAEQQGAGTHTRGAGAGAGDGGDGETSGAVGQQQAGQGEPKQHEEATTEEGETAPSKQPGKSVAATVPPAPETEQQHGNSGGTAADVTAMDETRDETAEAGGQVEEGSRREDGAADVHDAQGSSAEALSSSEADANPAPQQQQLEGQKERVDDQQRGKAMGPGEGDQETAPPASTTTAASSALTPAAIALLSTKLPQTDGGGDGGQDGPPTPHAHMGATRTPSTPGTPFDPSVFDGRRHVRKYTRYVRASDLGHGVKCPNPDCTKLYKHAISVFYHLLSSPECLLSPERPDLWTEQTFPTIDRQFLEHVYLDVHNPNHVLKCEWTGCKRAYPTMRQLVAHISRRHTPDIGEGQVCMWNNCGRAGKRTQAIMHMYSHINNIPWTPSNDPDINRAASPQLHDAMPMQKLHERASTSSFSLPPPRRSSTVAKPTPKPPASRASKSRARLHATDKLKASAYVPSFAARKDVKKQRDRAEMARENGRAWHGSTWAQDHPCDSVVGQGVRFAAALVLRNISRVQSARHVLLPFMDTLMSEAAQKQDVSKVLVNVLEALT
ncbi:hypothetical protein PTSG_01032 [Salpingoeca rosetta]|uniref:RFX-type winged-helix domain-containing protein n=1 Tax=Salpingoeca rosetta (strain ATCC 50818 / BSB-021) TaxID=946362 RepID=F2TY71_SALR5|nr:uncharacterized protein PTSG_01032 [Salpingoeca rosetta]EGD76330.1 hypothetical protein PTSG_01032 [Salpingoeca rosetta]|eukprot:XP_004998505.1 hypothetical protein PTSG_01032 [Salpingoeca rosetta]